MEYNLLIQVLVCLSEETQVRNYVIRRFIQLIPVLIGITFLSFAMMRMAGSDAITELYGRSSMPRRRNSDWTSLF